MGIIRGVGRVAVGITRAVVRDQINRHTVVVDPERGVITGKGKRAGERMRRGRELPDFGERRLRTDFYGDGVRDQIERGF